jgi:hypothetical protein
MNVRQLRQVMPSYLNGTVSRYPPRGSGVSNSKTEWRCHFKAQVPAPDFFMVQSLQKILVGSSSPAYRAQRVTRRTTDEALRIRK